VLGLVPHLERIESVLVLDAARQLDRRQLDLWQALKPQLRLVFAVRERESSVVVRLNGCESARVCGPGSLVRHVLFGGAVRRACHSLLVRLVRLVRILRGREASVSV
jgi:hypothetical protein